MAKHKAIGKVAQAIETELRAHGIPYVAVDEAKKALFAGAKLSSFTFVIYKPEGRNLLVWCSERTKERRDDFRQWLDIFGEGFEGQWVVKRAAGLVWLNMEGKPVTPPWTAATPPPEPPPPPPVTWTEPAHPPEPPPPANLNLWGAPDTARQMQLF